MDKFLSILDETHLYENKVEILLRWIFWSFSWTVGINSVHSASDKKAVASAYFIFAVSIMMEFIVRCAHKQTLAGRLISFFFMLSTGIMLLLSASALVGNPVFSASYDVMYFILLGVVFYITFDFASVWLLTDKETRQPVNVVQKTDNQEANTFNEKLHTGRLGNVK